MGRYVLRFTGAGPGPSADRERVRRNPRLTVLDDSVRMLLVEGSEEQVKKVVGSMPGWSWSPERTLRLPDRRPKPRRGPRG
ncbi:MAG: hypothetical protein JW820_03865 [Spirochaetales bacterium]|nr:hypothetical protein [Spirochaetales bacterium]